jgi:hypothetical protein
LLAIAFIPGADEPILCRDPIAVKFLSQGWMAKLACGKLFAFWIAHFRLPDLGTRLLKRAIGNRKSKIAIRGFPFTHSPVRRCYTPPMKFKVLQDNLRHILWQRIESGELTGLHLAQQTGFRQAHISNFLNKKRGLSLEGMDKVLSVQHLSVLDLLDPAEVNKRASIVPPSGDEFEHVLVASAPTAATQPLITAAHVKEILKFKKTFLRRLRTSPVGDRSAWQRFVVIKLDAKQAAYMRPRLTAGATLLLDRHYNSLTPYRKGELNLYAVLENGTCAVGYVEVAGNQLILRPHNQSSPLEAVTIEEGKTAADYLVGRVCHVGMEA